MTAEQQPRASQPAANWQPGLIAIHGNQTEALADTVLAWLAAHRPEVHAQIEAGQR